MTFLLFLASCSSAVTPTPPPTPQVINVHATQAALPWLTELFSCAKDSPVILNVTGPASAQIVLRLGETDDLSTPAYQVDVEEILIVTHRESPVQNLTLEQARELFAGQADPSVQLWVYASGEDLQEAFDRLVMAGRSVAPSAKLAASPQQMSDLLNGEKSAVGILPKHWKTGDLRIVFNAGTIPVLALARNEPEGAVRDLLICLQN